jgi:hypothetical protein
LVRAEDAEFYVEVSDPDGPRTIRDDRPAVLRRGAGDGRGNRHLISGLLSPCLVRVAGSGECAGRSAAG